MRVLASLLSTLPADGDPPGAELADLLSRILADAGEGHDGPDVAHRVAWTMSAPHGRGRVTCVLKLADPSSERWIVELSIRRKGLALLSGRADPDGEHALRAWAAALRDGLEDDSRVSDVRWAVPDGWWDA